MPRPTAKVERICTYCNQTFLAYKRVSKLAFCCKAHYTDYQKQLTEKVYTVETTCAYCQKSFLTKRCLLSKNQCCCRKHSRLHRLNRNAVEKASKHTQVCEHCGDSYVPKTYRKDRPQRFCSRRCSSFVTGSKKIKLGRKNNNQCAYCKKGIYTRPGHLLSHNYCCAEHQRLYKEKSLTNRQAEVLQAIIDYISESNYPPTHTELSAIIGTNCIGGATPLLRLLIRKGYVCSHHPAVRGIEVVKYPDGTPAPQHIADAWQNAPDTRYPGIKSVYTKYSGVKVHFQSSYEPRLAKVLDALGLEWVCHQEMEPILYTWPDGSSHRYLPDFHVPAWGVYINTKGWFTKKDQAKVRAIRASNPDMNLVIATLPVLEMYESLVPSLS